MKIMIPVRTVSEANVREHWAKKAKRAKAQRKTAYFIFSQYMIYPRPKKITLTRIAPRALDDDNLRGALKAVRDGIADSLGVDDSQRSGIEWEYCQRREGKKEYGVEVEM